MFPTPNSLNIKKMVISVEMISPLLVLLKTKDDTKRKNRKVSKKNRKMTKPLLGGKK